eukprot:g2269.t1
MLYTVYSVPNIFLPFVAGYTIDRYGGARVSVVLTFVVMLGHLILTIGLMTRSIWIMLLGRIVFGFGGEGLCVAQSAIVARWFEGKNGIAFAMGFQLSVARAGSVLAFTTAPSLVEKYDIIAPFWIGVALTGLGIVSAVGLVVTENMWVDVSINTIMTENDGVNVAYGKVTDTDELSKGDTESAVTKSDETDIQKEAESIARRKSLSFDVGDFNDYRSILSVDLRDLTSPSVLAFWLITTNCVITYGSVYPFNSIGSAFLIDKFICSEEGGCCGALSEGESESCARQENAERLAGQLLGLPLAFSGITSPFIGAFVDVCGHKTIFVTLSAMFLCSAHAWLSFAEDGSDPIGALLILGAGFSIYGAVLWPCVPSVVKKEECGLAFGIVNCLQNLGLAVWPIIIVSLRARDGDYVSSEHFFLVLSIISVATSVALICVDCRGLGGQLTNGSVRYVVLRCCGSMGKEKVHDDDDDESKEPLLRERLAKNDERLKGTINRGGPSISVPSASLSSSRTSNEDSAMGSGGLTRRRLHFSKGLMSPEVDI